MATFQFNQSNWQQVWTVNSVPVEAGLVSLTCPLTLNTNAVAIMMSASALVGNYRLGAYIERHVLSGLIIGEIFDARLDAGRKLYLNKLQIFTYASKCEFSLSANCLVKGDVQLFAWEYVEP